MKIQLSVLSQINKPSVLGFFKQTKLESFNIVPLNHMFARRNSTTLILYHDYKPTILCCSISLLVIGNTIDNNFNVTCFIRNKDCPTRTEHTSCCTTEAVHVRIVRICNYFKPATFIEMSEGSCALCQWYQFSLFLRCRNEVWNYSDSVIFFVLYLIMCSSKI